MYIREKLREMYQVYVIQVEKKRQEQIRRIVDKITCEILLKNESGVTTYTKVMYRESEDFVSEIIHQLQKIFVDSVKEVLEDDRICSHTLKFIWTVEMKLS